MPRPKGLPKTGGRKKGSVSKEKRAMVAKAAAAGLLPHEFLCAISQGQTIDGHKPTFEERVSAAVEAAPYYAGKRATVAHTGVDDGPIRFDFASLTDEQIAALEPVFAALVRSGSGSGSTTH